ncbi:helix-turn-helix domain-containing protein [Sphingomonas oligophenolica]|uniref:DNA-binding protein n=1 Tax=Sphingomonas oligophenolica TaxID=301154 RepID=A0A502CKS2_9SPHN|nr:helix-turn-helix domain-containing protein [Sphingomonas oligophenolica]TPG13170.1 DNA-binding protein [Sphingomonas oligophenolica]
MSELLNEAEAAEVLRISPRLLRDLRTQGRVAYVKIGSRRILYRLSDLEEYIQRCVTIVTPLERTPGRTQSAARIGRSSKSDVIPTFSAQRAQRLAEKRR